MTGKRYRGLIAAFLLLAFCIPARADLLSLSFTDAPVHYILGALGTSAGLNFAISKDAGVKTVSVTFNDVSIKDALDMLSIAGGISIDEVKPKYYTVTVNASKERATETISKADADRTILKESIVRAFDVKYVSTDDVEKALKNIFGSNSAFQISKLAQDDKREHAKIVVSAGDNIVMNKVAELIKTLDRPKPMIEIEAIFVETTRSKNKDFGVEWNAMTEPLLLAEQLPESGFGDAGKFGTFLRTNAWQSEALLRAIQTDGNGRVLANPKMRVISGQAAEFASETQVPILSKDSDGDVNTEWKNVGISLVILPSKLEDGTIRLHVQPRVSSIVGEKKLGDVVAPVISERKSSTTVFLRDGEVFLIGGLMSDREIKTMSKVPVLHQIPLFGELFKSNKTEIEKSNIMIVLRPREIIENTEYPETYKPASSELKEFVEKKGVVETKKGEKPEKDYDRLFRQIAESYSGKQSGASEPPAEPAVKQEPAPVKKVDVQPEEEQETKRQEDAKPKDNGIDSRLLLEKMRLEVEEKKQAAEKKRVEAENKKRKTEEKRMEAEKKKEQEKKEQIEKKRIEEEKRKQAEKEKEEKERELLLERFEEIRSKYHEEKAMKKAEGEKKAEAVESEAVKEVKDKKQESGDAGKDGDSPAELPYF